MLRTLRDRDRRTGGARGDRLRLAGSGRGGRRERRRRHGRRLLTHRRPLAEPAAPSELAGWSNRRLAAQLVFCSVPATNPLAGKKFARMGVGGIVILGGGARSSIGGGPRGRPRAPRPHGVKPFIASDEEGGQVQRLRDVIYPLPSARVQGGWSASKTKATAKDYGARLRKLHVSVVFGPVADLDVPGRYMSALGPVLLAGPEVVGSARRRVGDGAARPRGCSRPSSTGRATAGPSDTHSGAARDPLALGAAPRRHGAVRAGVRRRRAAGDGRAPALARGSRGTRRRRASRASALTYLRGRTGDDDRHHHRLAVHGGDDQGARHQAAGRRRAGAQGRRRPRAVRHGGPGAGHRRRDGGDQSPGGSRGPRPRRRCCACSS